MLSIAAYAPPGTGAFGLSLVAEVFSPRPSLPPFELAVCTDEPGPVLTDPGLTVHVEHGLSTLDSADLVLALPGIHYDRWSAGAVAGFRAAAGRGALVAGHCVGVFLLAEAGLLDGRRATTHWRFAAKLHSGYPEVVIEPHHLYIDEGQILTGAGAAAGLDMCLHLVRREHGAGVANAIARELVVPPHREGGQAQFVAAPLPPPGTTGLSEVLDWAKAHLSESPSVDDLAARARLSRRTFIRRFQEATGTSPGAWLIAQRLQLAEELLERTSLPLEEVARLAGYGSAAMLREQFVRRRGVPPSEYRKTFA
ncbi:GlxA family transcriptional regulator [Longispora albida]|uniref:GlxA family transcriptional regulator n=1 Tax=Longispora albida TaxID=203523 RepID=UPI0003651352|nr:helix-turn-helix domain-containing protein [Longispora albida]